MQVGLAPDALDARRAAALRGLVFKDQKQPLPGVKIVSSIFRPATFIEIALANLQYAILLGCADVALAASIFHFGEFTIRETKQIMAARGVSVRGL